MLLQFFKQANRKFILVLISFILLFRLGLALFLGNDILSISFTFVIHAIAAVGFNGVLVKTQVVKRYSVLPMFFLLLITSNPIFYNFSDYDLPFLLASLSLIGLSRIYPAEDVNNRLFNSAFLLTLLAYFFPSSIVYTIPFIFCFQFVFDLNQVRKLFLVLTALVIPIYLWLTLEFVLNDGIFKLEYLTQYFSIQKEWSELPINHIFSLVLIAVVGVLGLADLQAYIQHKAIIARKFILYLGLLACVESILLFLFKAPGEAYVFLLLPLVIVLANYFDHIKARLVHQVLFGFCVLFTMITPFFLN